MTGTYLKQSRHGTMLYFRRRVPDDLRARIGKPYLTKSLGTGARREAIMLARAFAVKTDSLFEYIRTMHDDDQTNDGLRINYEFFLDLKALTINVKDAKPEDQKSIDSHIATALQNLPATGRPQLEPVSIPGSGITIGEAWAGYRAEQISLGQRLDMKGGWKDGEDTATYDYLPHIEAFIGLVGDKHINAVTADDVDRFQQHVLTDTNGGKSGNRKKRLVRAGAVFRWAKKKRHIPDCFTDLFRFPGVVEKNPYIKFEHSDLVALFESGNYRDSQFENPFEYWLPVLALHTGSRLNELAQLTVSDIGKHEGVDTISILDEELGKRLKNKSSRRIIPIHSELLRLGFLDYVATISSGRIFPELSENPQRPGDYSAWPSRTFTNYRRSVGVMTEKKKPDGKWDGKGRKTFHSFRSTLISALRKANVPKERRTRLAGHEYTDTQDGTYDGGDALTMFDFATLKQDIEQARFDVAFIPYKPTL